MMRQERVKSHSTRTSPLTSADCSLSSFFLCLSLTTWFLNASQVALGILGRSINSDGSFSGWT